MRSGGVGKKVSFRASWIESFSNQDFYQSNKHHRFWYIVSTGYFCFILWAIALSDFCPLEIFKNLDLPLSTITFTVKNHAGNHFYKYIYLFEVWESINLVFFIEIHVKLFLYSNLIYIWNIALFSVDSVKVIELHVVHTWRHMLPEWMKQRM